MGRQVKCQITKEIGDSSEFFRAPNGKYYKTEDIYNKWRRDIEDRKECIRYICEYADYKDGQYAPTFLNKMIADFGKVFGFDVLLETIQGCEKEFQWANDNKDFNNELGRMFYYKAIIGNNIADYYKRSQQLREQERKFVHIPTDIPEDIDKIGCPIGGGKDLRNLLGDII